ncbi:MAG: twin-arginine translocation signal domain-containing protein [Marmoricola sp.]
MLPRRQFLTASAAAGLTAAGAPLLSAGPAAAAIAPSVLPHPAKSGIEHIVVVMMENRSFDPSWVGCPGRVAGSRASRSPTGTP